MTPIVAIALFAAALSAVAPVSQTDDRCNARAGVAGLPLIELPVAKAGGRFAIMISGDGGWRRIDTKVTGRLRDAGVPVVGFLAPEYFATLRTADESACALERIIRTYRVRWKREKVLLIGYSRGADVLPFMVSRLSPDVRQSVEVIALLGLERTIDFRYHPSWIPFYHPKEKQYQVLPEVEKLRGQTVLCFHGAREKDSLCRQLDRAAFTVIAEPGGHHFAGRYDDIAAAILAARKGKR
ncbi:MAG TPA: AcvB/VirJ family lysyl-phosphatidylglycerol hydrolase [Thermoanaerobaculia bacterium]|nr:AcvB/VirJ family lysyl-phosphatidylglycerol hydrolase [Thermoanaerobaculia bacterium]